MLTTAQVKAALENFPLKNAEVPDPDKLRVARYISGYVDALRDNGLINEDQDRELCEWKMSRVWPLVRRRTYSR